MATQNSLAAAALARLEAARNATTASSEATQEQVTAAENPSALLPLGSSEQHVADAAAVKAAEQPPIAIPGGMSVAALFEQFAMLQQTVQAQQQELEKLRAGDKVTATPPRVQVKAYYHNVPGSTVVLTKLHATGVQLPIPLCFYNGRIISTDPEIQAQLDTICDVPGSPVTSTPPTGEDPTILEALAEARASAEAAFDKLGSEAAALSGAFTR